MNNWWAGSSSTLRSWVENRFGEDEPTVEHYDKAVVRLMNLNRGAWRQAVKAARGGPKVLIATNTTGMQHAALLEACIAIALTLRGAQVHFMVCDAALPACQLVSPQSEDEVIDLTSVLAEYGLPQRRCEDCQRGGRDLITPLGLPTWTYSSLLSPQQMYRAQQLSADIALDAIATYCDQGVRLGEHALAGTLRFFARGDLKGVTGAEVVLRRYLEAAILASEAARSALLRHSYVSAVFHHGIYVPQGPTGDVCRHAGVPVVNSNPAYRRNTFIYSHDDTYHHTLMQEPTDVWEHLALTAEDEDQILRYLRSRRDGSHDWIWFHDCPEEDFKVHASQIGLDLSKPVIGMLSNVVWDAQLHYPANAFETMIEWAVETVRYFTMRPELQLLIRVHPAEIHGWVPSRQRLLPELTARLGALPANVFVVDADSPVSTYAAMDACNAVIIYGTKTGVELTAVGKPVIVAGEAWIRSKGLTMDASDRKSYFELLDALPYPRGLDETQRRRARQYAYHFFFRRMIPIPFIETKGEVFDFITDNLDAFRPGCSRGLDVICNGILKGTPFIYEAEHFGLHEAIR